MITKFELFKESEISSGNASGQGGGASLPFNKGYFQSSNTGEFGTAFTPTGEKKVKTFKNGEHSKKEMLKKKKKKEFLDKAKDEQNFKKI